MIQLFHIQKEIIDTSKFSNLLSDKIVKEFEDNFANYVGAKYAVSFNSATSAIFLLFSILSNEECENYKPITIPSILPPVVANALLNSNFDISFIDNIEWVGDSYILFNKKKINGEITIIDSAQKVQRNQYNLEKNSDNDLIIYSFYPTKPIGSCDGGIIVSNNNYYIEKLRILANNGMSIQTNNWDKEPLLLGHKMYMNSIQAFIANENLKRLDAKKRLMTSIRNTYNTAFSLNNTSEHLYRINVSDNKKFIETAKKNDIICGIHYKALHLYPLYSKKNKNNNMELSEHESKTTVSIPYHENLSYNDVQRVIDFVYEYKNI